MKDTHPFRTRTQLSLVIVLAAVALSGCGWSTKTASPAYTHVRTVTAAGSDIGEPFGIAVRDGRIYLSDGVNGSIVAIDPDGTTLIIASGLNTPSGIAFLPDGDLVVADTGSHTIRTIGLDGTVSIFAGVENVAGDGDGESRSATFNAPVGVAANENGDVYVADTYNDRIRIIERHGVVATKAGSSRGFADGPRSTALFDTPLGIALMGDRLLVADSGNRRVRVVEPSGGDVWTLAGTGRADLIDGTLSSAAFISPTAIAVDYLSQIFVADGNAIRVIGRRPFPFVETIGGGQRGRADGHSKSARFHRPSGLAIGPRGELYVADSDNRVIRTISDDVPAEHPAKNDLGADTNPPQPFPLATRWPFDPPTRAREIAGTLGEIRGDIDSDKPVWFHNGLDIAGAYGETAVFIRDETVLDPHSAENFGTARELLRLPLIGYIHLRLGRDRDNQPFGDPRFQFDRDVAGERVGVRVRRGARFRAGDVLGTLNSQNHVHLIAGRSGNEINALAALVLPGIADTINPVIESVELFTHDWQRLEKNDGSMPEKIRIVVGAYDRIDGNSERRRLGVYRIGIQVLSADTPTGDVDWRIVFDRMPANEAVRLAYAAGSQSGYTGRTVFNYIATNRIDGDAYREDLLDTTSLAAGKYTLRILVADFFGNTAVRDVEFVR